MEGEWRGKGRGPKVGVEGKKGRGLGSGKRREGVGSGENEGGARRQVEQGTWAGDRSVEGGGV